MNLLACCWKVRHEDPSTVFQMLKLLWEYFGEAGSRSRRKRGFGCGWFGSGAEDAMTVRCLCVCVFF